MTIHFVSIDMQYFLLYDCMPSYSMKMNGYQLVSSGVRTFSDLCISCLKGKSISFLNTTQDITLDRCNILPSFWDPFYWIAVFLWDSLCYLVPFKVIHSPCWWISPDLEYMGLCGQVHDKWCSLHLWWRYIPGEDNVSNFENALDFPLHKQALTEPGVLCS